MAVEYSPSFFLGRRDDIVNNMASESRGRDFVSVSVMLKVKILTGNVPAVTVGTVLWRRYAGASLEEKKRVTAMLVPSYGGPGSPRNSPMN